MEVNFRSATRADLEDIITLTNLCFDEQTSLAYAEKIWDENANDSNQIYLNGYLNGELVAHTKITIIPTIYEEMNTFAILNHVCVKPDLRRHHLGTKLLDEVFRICQEHQVKNVELWSKNFRTAAHGLYHHYGFEVVYAKFFSKYVYNELEREGKT